MTETMLSGEERTAGEIFSRLDSLDPLGALQQQAEAILTRTDRPFTHLLAEWLSGLPESQKAYRVAVMREMISRETARALFVGMFEASNPISKGADLPRETRVQLYLRLKALTESVRANFAKGDALKDFAVTDFQRLEIKDEGAAWTMLTSMINEAESCDEASGECVRKYKDLMSKLVSSFQGRPRSFEILLGASGFRKGDDPAPLAVALAKTLVPIGDSRSFAEMDQAVAPVILAIFRKDGTLTATQDDRICVAADRYSRDLMAVANTEGRIFQHESAILLSYLCRRNWGSKHALILARADLDPGIWLTILVERLRRTSAP
jgi:hypothetical protein